MNGSDIDTDIKQSLHVWDFHLLWPPILIPLFWHIMTGSNEWAWHHMAVESASPILLLLSTSPSVQSISFIVWGWLLSSFMEWGSPSIILCPLYTPKLFVVYHKQTSMIFEVIIFTFLVFHKLLELNRQFTLKMGSNTKMVLSVAVIDEYQDFT
jgi:hypothetical protein